MEDRSFRPRVVSSAVWEQKLESSPDGSMRLEVPASFQQRRRAHILANASEESDDCCEMSPVQSEEFFELFKFKFQIVFACFFVFFPQEGICRRKALAL